MTDLLRPLRIGNVELANNLVLSPMAGFTDLPFRVLAKRHGAGLVCSEMVSAASVTREVDGTLRRMASVPDEEPMSIQMFGTDPDAVADAARDLERRCAILGFNMGCPAHQIKRQGCGAALLDHPDLALRLVESIKGASRKPLLVKMRAGNHAAMDVVAFARALERAGADGLIFHARTAAMGYSGRADWSLIRAVKDAVAIPILGNGDVVDGASAERALRESGADGVAIGRASLGDPRVFGRIAARLATGVEPRRPTPEERLADIREYVRLAATVGLGGGVKGEGGSVLPLGVAHVKSQVQQFAKGIPGGSFLRAALVRARTEEEMLALFDAHVADTARRRAASSVARVTPGLSPSPGGVEG